MTTATKNPSEGRLSATLRVLAWLTLAIGLALMAVLGWVSYQVVGWFIAAGGGPFLLYLSVGGFVTLALAASSLAALEKEGAQTDTLGSAKSSPNESAKVEPRSSVAQFGGHGREVTPLVLLVGESANTSTLVRDALARDYRLAEAANGAEGLARAMELRPDVILGEVAMPDMTGEQMVREIRAHPQFVITPIVLLAPSRGNRPHETPGTDTAEDYLSASCSAEEVRARVSRLVAERRANEAELARVYELMHHSPAQLDSPAKRAGTS